MQKTRTFADSDPTGTWSSYVTYQTTDGAWHDDGLHLTMAVNLSMANLHDPQLPDTIVGLLRSYDVPPACLRIEALT